MQSRKLRSVLPAAIAVVGAASAVQAANYSTVVLADNPVGYYRLGESGGTTAVDSSTTGADGTYNNFAASAFGKTGIPGAGGNTAVQFDGTNDWVSAANGAVGGGDQTYTLEVWVNIGTTSPVATGYAVTHLRSGENNRYHALGVTTGATGILSQKQNTATGDVTTTTPTLNDGNWHHLVGVFGSGNAANEDLFYVDGSLVGGVNGPTEDGATNRFFIGLLHNKSGGTGYFNGLIDEAAIYNSQLTASEVLAHYNAGITPGSTVPEPAMLGLVGLSSVLILRRRRS